MRTSETGSRVVGSRRGTAGFTLLELLVVLALTALASTGVIMALASPAQGRLAEEGDRLAAILDAARAQSRLNGLPVTLTTRRGGFDIDGLEAPAFHSGWLHAGTEVVADAPFSLTLPPEPVIGARRIVLRDRDAPGVQAIVSSDGLRPFGVEIRTDAP